MHCSKSTRYQIKHHQQLISRHERSSQEGICLPLAAGSVGKNYIKTNALFWQLEESIRRCEFRPGTRYA